MTLTPCLASALLRRFWKSNARRDAARLAGRARSLPSDGVEPSVEAVVPSVTEALIQSSRTVLMREGVRAEVAETFLQRAVHEDVGEALQAVERACGIAVSPATARQWGVRHFGRVADILRAHAEEIGLR